MGWICDSQSAADLARIGLNRPKLEFFHVEVDFPHSSGKCSQYPHLKLLSAPSAAAATPQHTSAMLKCTSNVHSRTQEVVWRSNPVHGRLVPHCICNPTPFCGGGTAASLHTRIRNGKTASLISAARDTLLAEREKSLNPFLATSISPSLHSCF